MKWFYSLQLLLLLVFTACSDDLASVNSPDMVTSDGVSSVIANLPISSIEFPDSFVLGETYTIDFKYILPNGCYYYESLDYSVVTSTEIVLAVEVYVDLESNCTQAEKEGGSSFVIKIENEQDYTFKLWKGTDANGESVYEDFIVPVL